MRLLGNLLWLVLGGFWMGLGWIVAGVVMLISIIGIPWARSCFVLAGFSFFPFGREAISRNSGTLSLLGNIIWFVLAGWWLAIGHLVSAVACAVTIIGIPFAVQHVKLGVLALWPFGRWARL